MTRYGRLMKDIITSGVKTKVLMLSATPVNSRMNDLKNQVAFITAGRDDALCDHGVTSLEQTLEKAKTRFNQWLRLSTKERTAESLLEALNFDYFKVLDLLTIARSRKHVEKYYGTEEVGAFPVRLKPVNIKADIDASSLFAELREVNRDIRKLNLAAFAPLRYVRPDKIEEYSRKYDIQLDDGSMFRQLDREESLIHLMRVNLLKRMESSIHSFALTLGRLLTVSRTFCVELNHTKRPTSKSLVSRTLKLRTQNSIRTWSETRSKSSFRMSIVSSGSKRNCRGLKSCSFACCTTLATLARKETTSCRS